MPYGDKEKQQLYQKLYYEKFIKKPTITKKGNLKIDLLNYKPKPMGDVRNPTLNHTPKPLKFEDDRYKNLDTKGNPIDFLDDDGNLKTNKQLIPLKNKTVKRINSLYEIEELDNKQSKNDIPRWIHQMTDDNIKIKIDEISKCLKEEDMDKIINGCNILFGDHKSRTKLEYACMEMLKKYQTHSR